MLRVVALSLAAVLCAADARSAEFPESPDAPSAFVTVIDARDFDDRLESVQDVLERAPGVHVRRLGGLGAASTASIRGSKPEQVLVLLDGVRLNTAQRGAVDLSTIPLRQVDRIEVIRGGAASARYGSDAVGGVISITTRQPEEDGSADYSVTTGRYETLGADAAVSLERGPVSALLSYERLSSENDFDFTRDARDLGPLIPAIPAERFTRVNADYVRDTGLLRGALATGASSQLVGTLQLHRDDRGQPGSVAGAFFGATDEQVSCATAEEQYRRGLLDLKWRHWAAGPGSLEASVFHRYDRTELRDPGFHCGFMNALDVHPSTHLESIDQQSGAEMLYALRPRAAGPLRISSRSSFSLRRDHLRGDRIDSPERWVTHLYTQQELSLVEGRLRVFPALGLDLAHTSSVTAREPGTAAPVSVRPDDDAEWLPHVGAILRLHPSVRVKANYGRSYRRPNFNELFFPDFGFVRGNPELVPEESWDFDVGVEMRRTRLGPVRDLSLEATYFHRDLEDPIEWVQVHLSVQPRNLDASRERGYELGGSLTLADRLELSGSYTFLDAEQRSSGRPLPHRPRNQYFASASLRMGPMRIWTETTYYDEVFINTAAERELDSAHLLDVGFSLPLASMPGLGWVPGGLRISSEWVNVTDEERYDSFGFPLPGQMWYLRLQGRAVRRGPEP